MTHRIDGVNFAGQEVVQPAVAIPFEQPNYAAPDSAGDTAISHLLQNSSVPEIIAALSVRYGSGAKSSEYLFNRGTAIERHGNLTVIKPSNSSDSPYRFVVKLTHEEQSLIGKAIRVGDDIAPYIEDYWVRERRSAGKKAGVIGTVATTGAGVASVVTANVLPTILTSPVVAEAVAYPGGALVVGAVALTGIAKAVRLGLDRYYTKLPKRKTRAQIATESRLAEDYIGAMQNLNIKIHASDTVVVPSETHSFNPSDIIAAYESSNGGGDEAHAEREYEPYLPLLQTLSEKLKKQGKDDLGRKIQNKTIYTTTPAALVEEIIAGRPTNVVHKIWGELGLKDRARRLAELMRKHKNLEMSENEAEQQHQTKRDVFIDGLYEDGTRLTKKAVNLAILDLMQFAQDCTKLLDEGDERGLEVTPREALR